MKLSFEQNGGTYRQVGDYLISNLTLPLEAKKPIGVWGQRHKDYLKKYNEVTFNTMLANGTLWSYLADINEQASDMFSRLVKELAEKEGVSQTLKAQDQMAWVWRMNNIRNRAIEIVNADLIYNV